MLTFLLIDDSLDVIYLVSVEGLVGWLGGIILGNIFGVL